MGNFMVFSGIIPKRKGNGRKGMCRICMKMYGNVCNMYGKIGCESRPGR